MMEDLKKVPKEVPVADKILLEEGKIREIPLPPGVTKEKVTDKEYTLEITRDWYGKVDITYLNKKDPNYEYRFLRDDKPSGGKNISTKTGNLLFQKGGWQICPQEHLLRIGFKQEELSGDNLLRRGDLILAFMPKKLFAEKAKHKIERANEPIKAIKRLIEEGDPSLAGIGHRDMKGIQPKEALKGNWK